MTLREIVEQLRQGGSTVNYRARKDGSIVIKSINGRKYKGKAGNFVARALTGQTPTAKQTAQRAAALSKENLYQPKEKSHRKKVSGLKQSERRFISDYNRTVKKINAKYKPKNGVPTIGAKQARQAMSRGTSFADWRKAAIEQARKRALNIPQGEFAGKGERDALAAYIRTYHKNNPQALKVADYISGKTDPSGKQASSGHRVTQDYLNKLHDLVYRKDTEKINWDNALEEAKKANKQLNEQLTEIRDMFKNL